MSESHLPTEYELHPFEVGLNSPTLVVYDDVRVGERMDDVLEAETTSMADKRGYVRLVRLHTALDDERLTIIDEDSAYYNPSFEDMELGEERRL